jgi:putative membrane protein
VKEENEDQTTWNESPFLYIKGFFMGSADIVPGVSGGTLALILGIYNRLMHAIKSVDKQSITALFTLKFKRLFELVHWRFLVILLTGMLSAFLFFTKVVPLQVYMFTDPEIVYGLFFGLIVGSIFFLAGEIENRRWIHLLWVGLGTLIGFWVVTLVPTSTPENPFFVFFSGSIAICAMVLPGISGSYLLLILRKYDYILAQIGRLGTEDTLQALIILAPFGLGAVVGLALFSRLLSWLLDNYYAATLATLIGFLIGSLYIIWPFQHRQYHETVEKRQVMEMQAPIVQQLRENPPSTERPEYKALGDTLMQQGQKRVEVVTVKRKLLRSRPYVPYVSASTPAAFSTGQLWRGIIGSIIGLLLVAALERIR